MFFVLNITMKRRRCLLPYTLFRALNRPRSYIHQNSTHTTIYRAHTAHMHSISFSSLSMGTSSSAMLSCLYSRVRASLRIYVTSRSYPASPGLKKKNSTHCTGQSNLTQAYALLRINTALTYALLAEISYTLFSKSRTNIFKFEQTFARICFSSI